MGSSKTHRGGPSWAKNNTARGKESIGGYSDKGRSNYSTGDGEQSRPQGDVISTGKTMRDGLSNKARNKTSSSRSSVKTKTPYGQS